MKPFNKVLISLLFLFPLVSVLPARNITISLETDAKELISGDLGAFYTSRGQSFTANITAYSSSPDETDDSPFYMANGNHVYDGAVACPRSYEFDTKLLINGKIYTCEDRFNKRYELALNKDGMVHIDIWKGSKEEAIEFGRQYLEVVKVEKSY